MNFILISGIFIIVWWIVLFTILPIGVKIPKKATKGHATSAPSNPRIKLKILATTIIAAFMTLIMFYIFTYQVSIYELLDVVDTY